MSDQTNAGVTDAMLDAGVQAWFHPESSMPRARMRGVIEAALAAAPGASDAVKASASTDPPDEVNTEPSLRDWLSSLSVLRERDVQHFTDRVDAHDAELADLQGRLNRAESYITQLTANAATPPDPAPEAIPTHEPDRAYISTSRMIDRYKAELANDTRAMQDRAYERYVIAEAQADDKWSDVLEAMVGILYRDGSPNPRSYVGSLDSAQRAEHMRKAKAAVAKAHELGLTPSAPPLVVTDDSVKAALTAWRNNSPELEPTSRMRLALERAAAESEAKP